jgi:hypothetical protein
VFSVTETLFPLLLGHCRLLSFISSAPPLCSLLRLMSVSNLQDGCAAPRARCSFRPCDHLALLCILDDVYSCPTSPVSLSFGTPNAYATGKPTVHPAQDLAFHWILSHGVPSPPRLHRAKVADEYPQGCESSPIAAEAAADQILSFGYL